MACEDFIMDDHLSLAAKGLLATMRMEKQEGKQLNLLGAGPDGVVTTLRLCTELERNGYIRILDCRHDHSREMRYVLLDPAG